MKTTTFLGANREIIIIVGLVVFAAVLRFWNLSSLGLTHFDEGSYAMTGRWIATFGKEGWIYQSGHAPGLFPTLIGFFFLVFGVTDYVAIAVSAVAGSLTVGLTYYVGKVWFNRTVGIIAALFLATTEYHLIYSRLALTDALFALFFWGAMACFFQGLRTTRRSWFVIGGLITGLCWNTKYHGFFPLVIVGLWLSSQMILNLKRGGKVTWGKLPWRGFTYATLAANLVYIPWFLFVQISVGYGEIFGYQLGYLFSDESSLHTSFGTLFFYLKEWLSVGLLVSAALGLGLVFTRKDDAYRFLLVILTVFAGAALLYASFPRLFLPLVPGICLLSALAVCTLVYKLKINPGWSLVVISSAILLLNLVGAQKVLGLTTIAYREAGRYLQNVDEPVITQMSKNFYFYDHKKSVEMRQTPVVTLDSLLASSSSVTIAVDPIIQRFPEYFKWFEERRDSLQLVQEFYLTMYAPVYYQGFDPTQAWNDVPLHLAPFRPGEAKIEIYRFVNRGMTKARLWKKQ